MAGRSKAPKCPNCGHLHINMINKKPINNGAVIYFNCDKCNVKIESKVIINYTSKLI